MTDSCWLWTGSLTRKGGYGQISLNNYPVRAHRVSYEWAHGPVPDGLSVLHRCDTPACVNPDHLFAGTRGENAADRVRKGRNGPRRRGDDHYTRRPEQRARYEKAMALLADGRSVSQVARELGLTYQGVRSMKLGRTWR